MIEILQALQSKLPGIIIRDCMVEGGLEIEITSRRYRFEMTVNPDGSSDAWLSRGNPAKAHLESQWADYAEFATVEGALNAINEPDSIFARLVQISKP